MSRKLRAARATTIHLIHDDLASTGVLHYLPEKNAFEIVIETSGTLGTLEPYRMPLTKKMMDLLEILPDGNVRIEY